MPSKLRTQLGDHEFAVPTSLSDGEIVHAADRAEHAAEPATESIVVPAATRPDGIAYEVIDRSGRFQLTFAVTWTEAEPGMRLVRLAVGDYLTTRTTWLRVPLGRRSVPGLPSLARYSAWMQKELDAHGRIAAAG